LSKLFENKKNFSFERSSFDYSNKQKQIIDLVLNHSQVKDKPSNISLFYEVCTDIADHLLYDIDLINQILTNHFGYVHTIEEKTKQNRHFIGQASYYMDIVSNLTSAQFIQDIAIEDELYQIFKNEIEGRIHEFNNKLRVLIQKLKDDLYKIKQRQVAVSNFRRLKMRLDAHGVNKIAHELSFCENTKDLPIDIKPTKIKFEIEYDDRNEKLIQKIKEKNLIVKLQEKIQPQNVDSSLLSSVQENQIHIKIDEVEDLFFKELLKIELSAEIRLVNIIMSIQEKLSKKRCLTEYLSLIKVLNRKIFMIKDEVLVGEDGENYLNDIIITRVL
jgi:hypothetical protein